MKTKNYYHILGVSQDVDADGIKNAYRKLAHKYHPDVSPAADGEEKFKEIGEAYETLKTPARRLAYDRRILPTAGRQISEQPLVDFCACWSEIPWVYYWCRWINPEQWQDKTMDA